VSLTKSPAVEPLRGSQEPRIRVRPAAVRDDSADLVELCAGYGLALDGWQQLALGDILGLDDDGQWSAGTAAVVAARQSGKGVLIEALALGALLLYGEKTVACSAHEARTTRLSFERVLTYFDNYSDLTKRVAAVQRWVGREQIRLRDGSMLVFPARSRGALRGYSIDRLLIDEAQYLTNAQLEAVLPTMSARPNTQIVHFGTVPTHAGDGEVFLRLRAAALSGNSRGLTYLEWSAPADADLDDRAAWAQANPALGARISVEAIVAERQQLSNEGFRRERLSIFPTDRVERVVNMDVWAGLAAPGPAGGELPTAVGVDRLLDGRFVIAFAWVTGDGRTHVEVVRAESADPLLELGYIEAFTTRSTPVVMSASSTANVLLDGLRGTRPTPFRNGIALSDSSMEAACQSFLDEVLAGRLTHSGQKVLDDAVSGARRRPRGDAGGWVWDRRDESVTVSPLYAVTAARYGATTVRVRRTGGATFV
jgi:hypothetical protein